MIDKIKSNYYKTTPAKLKLNIARTNTTNNTNTPFKTITNKIETVINFAGTGKVPYTPKQVVIIAYGLIFVTGYFTNACSQWN